MVQQAKFWIVNLLISSSTLKPLHNEDVLRAVYFGGESDLAYFYYTD